MNIQINQLSKKIKELHNLIGIQLRTPIKTAIEIGGLLLEAKQGIEYGKFNQWINDNFQFSEKIAYNYMKLFEHNDKIVNCTILQDAYKLIETIEKQEKYDRYQKRLILIKEYKETGIKPEGWDRSLDYEYNKQKKENEDRTQRIKEVKNKMTDGKVKSENNYKVFDEVNELVNELQKSENKKTELKQQIGMTVNDESKFIEALNSYLSTLETDNIRLNTLHNIIKFCKNKINEYQIKSIK